MSGEDQSRVQLTLPGKITDAYEVNGQEKRIADAAFTGNKLTFDLGHYTIKSFAVKLEKPALKTQNIVQEAIPIDYNEDAFSYDRNRDDANLFEKFSYSYPAELVPDEIVSEGIRFKMGSKEDGKNNILACQGQEITIPEGYTKLCVLAVATEDTVGTWNIGDKQYSQRFENWTGFIGQYYKREFAKDGYTLTSVEAPFSKTGNIAWYASHRHLSYPSKNEAYQYSYMFKYEFGLSKDVRKIQLPANEKIKILALTVARNMGDDVLPLAPLSDDFENDPVFTIRK
ncbi:MAG: hypothetical protein ACK5HT_17765 [Draconibacterium sp.]